jgi:hypothetical protein
MGLDFVRSKAGRPWMKKWAHELDLIKAPGLFDFPIDRSRRTITVELKEGCQVNTGDELLALSRGEDLDVCRGVVPVACAHKAARDILQAVREAGDIAGAIVLHVDMFGSTAEVELQ